MRMSRQTPPPTPPHRKSGDGEGRWQVDEWRGCYPSNWRGSVVEAAMTHPAKFSSRLIRRIYEHMAGEGWVKAGDGVLDPFGGVALGALEAMRLGLHWTGVELEEKFWRIGNENIALWNSRFGSMPRWGSARLLNGDSRKLRAVISEQLSVSSAVSSPPYAEAIKNNEKGSGIDYSKAKDWGKNRTAGRESIALGYGETVGQLGAMKADELSYQLSVSSPPFLQSAGGTPEPKEGGVIDARLQARHAAGNAAAHGYGRSEGQLSSMNASEESYQLSVSSPSEGDEFWLAARLIMEQVYEALEPGGHACWVVKDYVKAKQVVPFANQWRQLCEAVGFVTLHEHRAMLVHSKGRQGILEGGVHEVKTESKSFFRRLAEKKGSPRIDWEVVWCMEKP